MVKLKKLGESAFLAFAGRPSFCLFAKCPAIDKYVLEQLDRKEIDAVLPDSVRAVP